MRSPRRGGGYAAQSPPDGPVLVAYDGTPQAAAALRWAAHEAAATRLPLELVITWQRPVGVSARSGAEQAAAYAGRLACRAATTVAHVAGPRLRARQHVGEGAARSVVLRRAEGAGLLVMGTAGHVGRLGAVLGSVSRYVVERVDIPVVLLGPAATGYVESRIVLVARYGVADPVAASWAVRRARSRPARTLHLLDTWSLTGLGDGDDGDTTRHLAEQQAHLAHEEALYRLRRVAGDVAVSGSLFEGPAADLEHAHGLPGDLLVAGVAAVEHRPSLTRLRCPVAIVPAARAWALAADHRVADRASAAQEPSRDLGPYEVAARSARVGESAAGEATGIPVQHEEDTMTAISPSHRRVRADAADVLHTDWPIGDRGGARAFRYVVAAIRLSLGWVFLWAFLDKLLGLGHETARKDSWLNGGHPTLGFLRFGTKGPLADVYQSFAGAAWADWLFMLGLAGIGIALVAGVAMRIAAAAGTVLMVLMWSAVLPPANNPFMDDHIVYALTLVAITLAGAGHTLGLGSHWERMPVVHNNGYLK